MRITAVRAEACFIKLSPPQHAKTESRDSAMEQLKGECARIQLLRLPAEYIQIAADVGFALHEIPVLLREDGFA